MISVNLENGTMSFSTQTTHKNTESENSPMLQEIAPNALVSKGARLTSNRLPAQHFVIKNPTIRTSSSDIEVTQTFESTTFLPIIHATTSTLKVFKKKENTQAFSIKKKTVIHIPTKTTATSSTLNRNSNEKMLPKDGLETNLQKKALPPVSKMTESTRGNRNKDVKFPKEIAEGDYFQIPVRVIAYDERPQAESGNSFGTETEPEDYELED